MSRQYNYSYHEKMETIEFLITERRWARNGTDADREIYHRMKSIAADYRARDRLRINDTIRLFEHALESAELNKKPLVGYEVNNLREIAERLIGAWPMIRQALEEWERINA